MKVFTKNAELSREMARGAGRTGLVPTMGALHEGHLSLVKKCREECDRAVVSVFVNPTQFNDPNDLKNYPRTEEADLALLEKTGVDYVLMPSVEDIYPQKDTRVFDLGTTDKTMEGAHRGSFQRSGPGRQPAVRHRPARTGLLRREGFPADRRDPRNGPSLRLPGTDHRMPDRSRCGRTGPQLAQRVAHPRPPRGRTDDRAACAVVRENAAAARTMSVEEFRRRVVERIDATKLLKTEYLSVVHAETLEEIDTWSDSFPMRCCIAVQAGDIRLIDNIAIA